MALRILVQVLCDQAARVRGAFLLSAVLRAQATEMGAPLVRLVGASVVLLRASVRTRGLMLGGKRIELVSAVR